MSDYAAMLAACDASRDDRTPHLAFVDWREEHGELDARQGLLERIWIEPYNDEWRLEYARELERNPRDESETARAELIRVQCELSRVNGTQDPECRRATKNNPRGDAHGYTIIKTNRPAPCVDCWKQLKDRERDLLARHEAEFRCPRVCERCGGERHVGLNTPAGPSTERCPTCHGLGRIGVLNEQQWTRLETGITGFSHVVQPTVTWSRGFPVIACPVAWWCEQSGERKCPQCANGGMIPTTPTPAGLRCSMCYGNRTVPDYPHARGCWEEQGYCHEVRLTDREPCRSRVVKDGSRRNEISWDWYIDDGTGEDSHTERFRAAMIPPHLFALMAQDNDELLMWGGTDNAAIEFPSAEAAHLALSRAAATWARGLACERGGVGV